MVVALSRTTRSVFSIISGLIFGSESTLAYRLSIEHDGNRRRPSVLRWSDSVLEL